VLEVSCITVDCASPPRLAEFWAAALGWRIVHMSDDGAYCAPSDGSPGLEFIRVDEPKTVKNRQHLGTHTTDVDTEVDRLVALGATVAWVEEFPPDWPYRNVVLRDPEGNEFCVGDQGASPSL